MDLVWAAVVVLVILWALGPIGFIAGKAGARTGTGRTAILGVDPASIDQRAPANLGTSQLVSQFDFAKKNAQSRSEAA